MKQKIARRLDAHFMRQDNCLGVNVSLFSSRKLSRVGYYSYS